MCFSPSLHDKRVAANGYVRNQERSFCIGDSTVVLGWIEQLHFCMLEGSSFGRDDAINSVIIHDPGGVRLGASDSGK